MRQEHREQGSYCSTKYIRKEKLKTSNSKWKYEINYFYKNKKKLLFLLFSLQTRLSNKNGACVSVTTGCLTLNLLNTTALITPSSPRQHNTLVSLLNTFSKTSTCRIFISSAVCSKLGWNQSSSVLEHDWMEGRRRVHGDGFLFDVPKHLTQFSSTKGFFLFYI